MSQNGVYDLLKMLELTLDEGYSVLKYTVVNKKEMEELIDRIYAELPMEIQEARVFLKKQEELQNEAQQRAARILQDAQAEADRKLSESDQLKNLERESNRIISEVQGECNKMKYLATQDSDSIRSQATEDAIKIKEQAELFASDILLNIENNLAQLQQVVKSAQVRMEQIKSESAGKYTVQNSRR